MINEMEVEIDKFNTKIDEINKITIPTDDIRTTIYAEANNAQKPKQQQNTLHKNKIYRCHRYWRDVIDQLREAIEPTKQESKSIPSER